MLRIVVLVLLLVPAAALAAPWRLLPETEVTVEVDWRGRTVPVRFPTVTGEIEFDAARPETASAHVRVATRDATVGLPPVDALMRSRDYLAAGTFPVIGFRLQRLVQTSRQTADIFGEITFRGVTRPIAFAAQVTRYGPAADDPDRFEAGFDLTGEIDRTAFGSTGGLPDVAARLPIRIRLLMASS